MTTVGIALDTVDQAAGDTMIRVSEGTFLLRGGSGADEITRADVNSDCFVIDDETVGKTNGAGARSKAGRVRAVEGANVWVTI